MQQIVPPIYNLGSEYYDEVEPAQFPKQILRYKNESLNLQNITDFSWTKLWDFKPLSHNISKPLALRYHGHQFRHYNPELGDGRGFLYAQIFNNNQWYDLGTKGSGTTPYSRRGDGRLTLKGAMREVLATEALESYGVKTSRTACFFETGEKLDRHDEPSPTRSAVLTRYSLGHIRIGTFQRLAYFNNAEEIKKLTAYVLKNYYANDCQEIDWQNDHEVSNRFFQCVSENLAHLCAQIMIAGFVHGVLNTDNINVAGELFDYGPYRFLPNYHPSFTAAYFDSEGLYAFGRQPESFLWSLNQLGQSLLIAYPQLPLQLLIENFELQFNDFLYQAFQNKLNIQFLDDSVTTEALSLFFQSLTKLEINYEEAFFILHSARLDRSDYQPGSMAERYCKLNEVIELKKLISSGNIINTKINNHTYFQNELPETLLIDEIEKIWKPISETDDWTLFENKIQSIRLFRGCYNL